MAASTVKNSQIFWGAMLIGFGALFLLDNLNIMDFGDFISNFWPVILILIGLRIIFSRTGKEEAFWEETSFETSDAGDTSSPDYLFKNQFIGDFISKAHSTDFRGGSISSFIGDVKLDLSDVEVARGQYILKITGFIGDINLVLPKEADYEIKASTTIGEIVLFDNKKDGFALSHTHRSAGYDDASARLFIQLSFFIGDITVH